ncbi:MAG TPA: hypothetical protein VFV02_04085 [Acidimicrobiales bacterium]|nr:hypothetical protein [Acidimicrobiales bacterium]
MTYRASTGDLSGNNQPAAEDGTETFNRGQDLSLLQSLENEMDEVRAALDRLEDGTYGRARYAAVPSATIVWKPFPQPCSACSTRRKKAIRNTH